MHAASAVAKSDLDVMRNWGYLVFLVNAVPYKGAKNGKKIKGESADMSCAT